MLEKLLTLLKDPRTHSLNDLAHALDTSTEMVETMLEDLQRMGYVRQVTGCDTGCEGCRHECACTPGGPSRVWAAIERRP
jgi:predicted ArsR family transcriptional regulator